MDYRRTEEDYRLYLKGDGEAFSRIVRDYRAPVTAFIARMMKGSDEAEDLAADVFVELLEHPGRYRFQSSLKTYLFAVAHHRTVDYLRKNSRRPEIPPVLPLPEEPESRLLAAERRREVEEAWNGLKEEYRMAVFLTAVEGLSYEEAARVMKKSVRQIRDYCRRGRQQLRGRLADAPGSR